MGNDSGNKPEMHEGKFTCPHCKVLAKQDWTNTQRIAEIVKSTIEDIYLSYRKEIKDYDQESIGKFCTHLFPRLSGNLPVNFFPQHFSFARCQSCSKMSIWTEQDRKMIYPKLSFFPDPNLDMDDEIKELYLEATQIFQDSPRASAALLRLCVEKLCRQLEEKKGDLNTCIGNLVEKGLNQQIQEALDYCRVIGNNALHPGQINIKEGPDTVKFLFKSVNYIAQEMITKPKEMEEKYSSLPEGNKEQIKERDKK